MRPSRTFLSPSLKNKKRTLLKNFGKWHFLTPRLKLSYIFSNKNFSSISGSRTFSKNFLYSGGNFPSSKSKNKPTLENFLIISQKKIFLYFERWCFLAPKLKTFLCFLKKKFYLFFGKGNF